MSKKVKRINKGDRNRVLLTELLPYEVPLIFSNAGLHDFFQNNPQGEFGNIAALNEVFVFLSKKNVTIPYDYYIRKSASSSRKLSIIHPFYQKYFVDFYEKYSLMLLHHCHKSSISLRHPEKIASVFYENDESLEDNDKELVQIDGVNTLNLSSYFTYEKVNFMFRFYSSYDFLRLERKFNKMLHFDIQKCFYSIYTHTISWAIKGKEFSKEHKKVSNVYFEKEFDDIMMNANYGETHGIVVGPEISRIFAEIILQKIDLEIITSAQNKSLTGLFELRRYVDDYFLFYNEEKVAETILDIANEKLSFYKLYINEKKKEYNEIPFITGITMAKMELKSMIKKLFLKINISVDEEDDIENGQNMKTYDIGMISIPNLLSNSIINDIKRIIAIHKISYEGVINLIFYEFKKAMLRAYKLIDFTDLDNLQKKNFINFIWVIYDVLFFVFSMDQRSRAAETLMLLIIKTQKYFCIVGEEFKEIIEKKISDELIFSLTQCSNKHTIGIEALNLLISLKLLSHKYPLSSQQFRKLFHLDTDELNKIDDNFSISYFNIAVYLFYIENKREYSSVKDDIEKYLIKWFTYYSKEQIRARAELTCCWFDMIKCPYISESTKKKIINPITPRSKQNIIDYICSQNWFISWNFDTNSLEEILKKREKTNVY